MTLDALMKQNDMLLRNMRYFAQEIIEEIPEEQRRELLEALHAWQQRWQEADTAELDKLSEDLYRTLGAFPNLRAELGLEKLLMNLKATEQSDGQHRAIDIEALDDEQQQACLEQPRLMKNTLYDFTAKLEKCLPDQLDDAD